MISVATLTEGDKKNFQMSIFVKFVNPCGHHAYVLGNKYYVNFIKFMSLILSGKNIMNS